MAMFSKIKSFLFENSSVRQTIVKNTFWLTAGQVVSRIVRAVIIIYAARVLGAASYGAFSYTLSLAGLFAIFSDIGLTSLLTREASRNSERYQGYLAASLLLKALLVGLSMILIIIVAPLFTTIPEARLLLPLAAFLLAFDSLRDFTFALTRARQHMQIEAAITILTNIAIAVLAFAVLFFAPSSKTLMVAYTVGSGIGLLIAAIFIGKEFRSTVSKSRALLGSLLKDAWPFALLGLLSGIMVSMDTLMLGWIRGASDVGLYGAAQRPILLLYALPALFATSLFPLLSKYAMVDKERFRNILEVSITACFLAALPVVVGGIIVSKQLMFLLYGAEYLGSTEAFSVLLLTLPIVFPAFIISSAIVAYNKQKTFFVFNSIGVVADIILNLALIPSLGIVGAAASTVATQAVINIIIWFKLKRYNPFSVFPRLLRSFVATIGMGLVAFFLTQQGFSVVVTIALAAAVYAGILYLLREPLIQEVRKAFSTA